MASKDISQQEYLRRYLSGGKDEKKKKKKKKVPTIQRMRIVDDDIDPANIQELTEGEVDLYELAENAPQVVGIVDERPAEVKLLERFQDRTKWRIVASEFDDVKIEPLDSNENSQSRESTVSSSRHRESHEDSDLSQSRDAYNVKIKQEPQDDSDVSPPRQRTSTRFDSDLSPPRRARNNKSETASRQDQSDSDLSPPRARNDKQKTQNLRNSSDSDISPPRSRNDKRRKDVQYRNTSHSDLSPPRTRNDFENKVDQMSSSRSKEQKNYSKQRISDSYSSQRKTRDSRSRHHSDSDLSPPRNSRSVDQVSGKTSQKDSHHQANQRNDAIRKENSKHSRSNKESSDSDLSPPRSTNNSKKSQNEKQTLDGKKAGLQDAKSLKEDLDKFRAKEQQYFNQMSDAVSGRGATAIVRDRKTGKKRNIELEEKERIAKEKEKEAKLARFKELNKGLVQVKEKEARIQDMIHESSKPLARYVDDTDLESMLKSQEREGDPMLEYLREKRRKENPEEEKPRYRGPAPPPNRFNIPPGHRWDGVDRSTGFEKKLFEHKNAKKALEEEAYKWSVADM